MKTIINVARFLLVLLIVSCVTVNVYFPAAQVQKIADKIVEEVRAKDNEPQETQKTGPSSSLDVLKKFTFGPKKAYADVNIDVSTPAIRGIQQSIKERFSQLKTFYDMGAVGENNKGRIEARDTAGLNLQQRSQLNRLIAEENKDRAALYKEIATANKLGPESISQIEKIFANSWREKSRTGWWVQNDNGVWSKQ